MDQLEEGLMAQTRAHPRPHLSGESSGRVAWGQGKEVDRGIGDTALDPRPLRGSFTWVPNFR